MAQTDFLPGIENRLHRVWRTIVCPGYGVARLYMSHISSPSCLNVLGIGAIYVLDVIFACVIRRLVLDPEQPIMQET
ncbi:hypothetical protein BDV93DRAFT_528949 [Ceratobasidium sp. AG-I]|nr:hypothetical protein BDV93DRAFT_528949 [Ceratobasidium sp. AG-I]